MLWCISSSMLLLLVNESPTTQFGMKRGLKQGDPFSFFLFNIVMKGLSCLFRKTCNLGSISGASFRGNEVHISHLQFANDMILFIKPNVEFLRNTRQILGCCELAAGLRINFNMSCVVQVPLGVTNSIEKLQRSFLWWDRSVKKKIYVFGWDTVCKSKKFRGLGIDKTTDKNRSLLAKWVWRFGTEENALWRKVICARYEIPFSSLAFRPDVKFVVGSFRLCIEAPSHKAIWYEFCPSKIEIFIWQALRGRVMVGQVMQNFGRPEITASSKVPKFHGKVSKLSISTMILNHPESCIKLRQVKRPGGGL
ncbi:hypothetical protein Ddye_029444 [Dipteronia dyeriana]|uniref:Reverse transcriptase domain-containing protein n=1 Tax=Dipteronia dyeriana TaxID=168575 RepID=A0AAD9WLH0_9ROSI|nr:hypothetical protein Ddye_029444 [Dipteronia dyeriana]